MDGWMKYVRDVSYSVVTCCFNWKWHGFLDAQYTRDLKWTSSVLVRVEVRVNRNALLPLFSARWVVNEARVEFVTRTSGVRECNCGTSVPCGLSRVFARMGERASERASRLFKARAEGWHCARETDGSIILLDFNSLLRTEKSLRIQHI